MRSTSDATLMGRRLERTAKWDTGEPTETFPFAV
jgi:hypothetical protein